MTEYQYDEFGNATETTYSDRQTEALVYRDGFFAPDGSEREELSYSYDANGDLDSVSGPATSGFDGARFVTELKDGKPVRHTISLDPALWNGMEELLCSFDFRYDADGWLQSEERADYFDTLFMMRFPEPFIEHYEFDEGGHILLFSENRQGDTEYRYEYNDDYSVVKLSVTKDGVTETSEEDISGSVYTARESALIPVRMPAEQLEIQELGSLDELYPALPDTLCGVALPTGDGSQRLSSVIMECMESTRNIPILTTVLYDDSGAPERQVLSFGAGGTHDDDEIYDEAGRLIRVSSLSSTTEYRYAEDGRSYTSTYTSGGGDSHDTTVRLADNTVPLLVRRTPEEDNWWADITYSEDGLPLVFAVKEEQISRFPENYGDVYSYEAEQGEDGSLRILYRLHKEGYSDAPYVMLEYDEHGYLTRFSPSWAYRSFTYAYDLLP